MNKKQANILRATGLASVFAGAGTILALTQSPELAQYEMEVAGYVLPAAETIGHTLGLGGIALAETGRYLHRRASDHDHPDNTPA